MFRRFHLLGHMHDANQYWPITKQQLSFSGWLKCVRNKQQPKPTLWHPKKQPPTAVVSTKQVQQTQKYILKHFERWLKILLQQKNSIYANSVVWLIKESLSFTDYSGNFIPLHPETLEEDLQQDREIARMTSVLRSKKLKPKSYLPQVTSSPFTENFGRALITNWAKTLKSYVCVPSLPWLRRQGKWLDRGRCLTEISFFFSFPLSLLKKRRVRIADTSTNNTCCY